MSNKECKISIDTDEKGNSTILMPDCTTQKLYDGEYCANNFDECFETHHFADGKASKYAKSRVPIRVYKSTKEPNARFKDHITVSTTVIILPDTEVYTYFDYSEPYSITKGRADSVYVIRKFYSILELEKIINLKVKIMYQQITVFHISIIHSFIKMVKWLNQKKIFILWNIIYMIENMVLLRKNMAYIFIFIKNM